jgi:hypothetical protein
MFKTVAVTISAAAFVTLTIALGPNVPDALATARAMIVTNDDVKLSSPARRSRFGFLISLANRGTPRKLRERSIQPEVEQPNNFLGCGSFSLCGNSRGAA